MMSRRQLLKTTGQAALAAGSSPLASAILSAPGDKSVRCVNIVNFIRGVEPRFETDLLLPVRKQMEIIKAAGLPATWLLQYDALVSGPFVEYLKANMPKDHEVGFWFEMNEMLVKAAGVEWRGRPGYEWDHLPPVAFTIGYSPEERIKLADTAMAKFNEIWGFTPKSIASWNLDAFSCTHLSEKYGVDAFAVCRDQIATDGFTIWGAPIAGYYPSKLNCWSPALDPKNQIQTPVLRMLGQDPVYYYDNRLRLPNGKVVHEPITMEPVWTSGRSLEFVQEFLKMIGKTESLDFAYAQLGQENSFPWPEQEKAYAPQMRSLVRTRDGLGMVTVETMGDTGRRFKKAFKTTPVQAQIMLDDPFGNTDKPEGSIWYQSRYYRANLHIKGDLAYLRDLTIYSDKLEQPFLRKATRQNDVEQRMPAVLDGYHWSKSRGSISEIGAGGFFERDGWRLLLGGKPTVRRKGESLSVQLPLQGGETLSILFDPQGFEVRITGVEFSLTFEWDEAVEALLHVAQDQAIYRVDGFDYRVHVEHGYPGVNRPAWAVKSQGGIVRLKLAQDV